MTVALSKRILAAVQPPFFVSGQQRAIIYRLFMDIAWMGVVSGTVGSFLAIYATRMGATDTQVGWLNAAPAVVNMLFGLPAGTWMKNRKFSQVVFWSAFTGRVFYLPICLLAFFLPPSGQVAATIWIILVMALPATLLNVSFNAMFAEMIPPAQRAYVVGGRNAILAITSLMCTLGSGKVLDMMPKPMGYQVVFTIGLVGAMLSSLHLFKIRNISQAIGLPSRIVDAGSIQLKMAQATLARRLGAWAGGIDRRFLKVILLLFTFHVAQWLVIPLTPLLAVHQLKLSDFQISMGASIFSLVTFAFSFQAARFINLLGNRKVTGIGMIGMGVFPLILALARGVDLFLLAHLIGAVSWSVLAVALLNYLLENTPERDRSVYMSYYIVASNAAILIGSLLGPFIASKIGYSQALAIFAALRALAGIAVLLWG
jgi:MFS family permease